MCSPASPALVMPVMFMSYQHKKEKERYTSAFLNADLKMCGSGILLGRFSKGKLVQAGHPQAQSGSRRSSAWKHRRRKSEWKARWLELRLRELRRQQARYEDQLAALQQGAAARASNPASSLEQTLPAAVGEVEQPGSDAKPASDNQQSTEAGDQAQGSASQAAGTAQTPGVDADRVAAQPRRRHDRQQARELAPASLLEHPFFAALAGVRTSKQVRMVCPCSFAVVSLPCYLLVLLLYMKIQ